MLWRLVSILFFCLWLLKMVSKFIEACKAIKKEMPQVHLSGGLSNLSFSFRWNDVLREVMHR
jgi:cobalamin-dependent methionine synthase I